MGGKSLRKSWSAADIERQLKARAEKPESKSLAKVFKGEKDEKTTDK